MSRIIQVSICVLNDPGDKGEPTQDEDIEVVHIYQSHEDTAQDWEMKDEISELADTFDRIMGARS